MSHGFAQTMKSEFEMNMKKELKFILGLQMKKTQNSIFLSKSKFPKDLVFKFGLQDSKPANTPISTSDKITKDLEGVEVDTILYRSIIGNLHYLATNMPDISFSGSACARYQTAPKKLHLKAMKRIIRYVNGTLDYGTWYPFDTNSKIVGCSEANWVGDVEDWKNINGCCFYIDNSLIS